MEEILADNGAVGGDITKMFHAGNDGDGRDGDDGGKAEFWQCEEAFGVVGDVDPLGAGDGRVVHGDNAAEG